MLPSLRRLLEKNGDLDRSRREAKGDLDLERAARNGDLERSPFIVLGEILWVATFEYGYKMPKAVTVVAVSSFTNIKRSLQNGNLVTGVTSVELYFTIKKIKKVCRV